MKRLRVLSALLLVMTTMSLAAVSALADSSAGSLAVVGPGDPWKTPPFHFRFGNHIDTHVQLKLKRWGGKPRLLLGALYVYFTGEFDAGSGLPVARHPRGPEHGEVCGVSPIECVMGWKMIGRPGAAKFLYHDGVNGTDHPIWLVNRAEEPSAPANGMVIPQPGYYSHFHWLSSGSQDPRARRFSRACDKKTGGALEKKWPTAANGVCDGWFLQLVATRAFAFQHGGETVIIRKGADMNSHLNLVSNYSASTRSPITPTRVCGHSGGSH